MKPAFLIAVAATALLGMGAWAGGGNAPPATATNGTSTQGQNAQAPQDQPARIRPVTGDVCPNGRGSCLGRGMGGGGRGMGHGPMMGRGMRLGPQDGTGPRRDGSCVGS